MKGGAIGIYDIQGKLIRTFASKGGGDGKINWDATDASGERVSCGIYFARAKTSQGATVTKILFLK